MSQDRSRTPPAARAATGRAHPTAPTDPGLTQADAEAAGAESDAQGYPDIPEYRFLGLLGRGGMGTVYLAEKLGDGPNPPVAIKVVSKAGGEAERRFLREREIMLQLQHPHIGRLYGGGTTGDGQPYLVMEYVEGSDIACFCDAARLSVRDRLRLFLKVCDGIAHAHRNLVVHRDIKPANILVTAQGEPKILDFGIAKPLDQPGDAQGEALTVEGVKRYTLQYASPEQILGEPVSIATDVYSAGVVLFELLTGRSPYAEPGETAPTATTILTSVTRASIQAPSNTLARLRREPTGTGSGGDPGALARERREPSLHRLEARLRGDLDAIVITALARDTAERYGRIEELAEDIRRYLDGRPVAARAASLGYRIGKFTRRYAWPLAAAASVVVFSVALAATMALQARTIANERDRVEQARANLEKVARFQAAQLSGIDAASMAEELRQGLVAEVRAAHSRAGLDPAAIESRVQELEALIAEANLTNVAVDTLDATIFDRALAAIEREFPNEPLMQARLRHTVGVALTRLGAYERAEGPLRAALATRSERLGNQDPSTLETMTELGFLEQNRGRLAEAEALYRTTLERREVALGPRDPKTLDSMNNLAVILEAQGKLADAEPLYRKALRLRRAVLGDRHPDTLTSINNMGYLLEQRGKLAEAEPYYREAMQGNLAVLGPDDDQTLISMGNYAVVLRALGRMDEAEPYYRRTIEGFRRTRGDEHLYTLIATSNMGWYLYDLGRLADAEPYFREPYETGKRVLGATHPATLRWQRNLGELIHAQGKPDQAEPLIRDAVERMRAELGDEHEDTLEGIAALADVHAQQGRAEAAERGYREAVAGYRASLGMGHARTVSVTRKFAEHLHQRGRLSAADALIAEALPAAEQALPADDGELARLRSTYGRILVDLGRFNAAKTQLEAAHEVLRSATPDPRGTHLHALRGLVTLYETWPPHTADEDVRAKAEQWRTRLAQAQSSPNSPATRPTQQPSKSVPTP